MRTTVSPKMQLKAVTQFWNPTGNQYVISSTGQLSSAPGFQVAREIIMRLMACMIRKP